MKSLPWALCIVLVGCGDVVSPSALDGRVDADVHDATHEQDAADDADTELDVALGDGFVISPDDVAVDIQVVDIQVVDVHVVDVEVVDAHVVDAGLDDSSTDAFVDAGALTDAAVDSRPDSLVSDAGTDAAQACASCDDRNACTADRCISGTCQHVAIAVDDSNACTIDACNPASGITHPAVATDDGDPCTVDSCSPTTGVRHAPLPVDDGNACTTDSCGASGIAHTPVAVDDANPCTTDACNALTGISHTPISVDDGNACTADACGVAGVSHTPISVDDSNACTTDTCNPASGAVHAPINVDDSNACTTDTCNPASGAVHTPISVDDSNACTTDTCNPASGAVHAPINVDDSNACTTDTCNPANGAVHTPISVDDSNACTTDICNPATGVLHSAVATDDDNVCTIDSCDPAVGVSHSPVPTDDGNACTTDSCDPLNGVLHTAVSVDDNNTCTTDSCDSATGVTHTPIAVDDNIACTVDACGPGGVSHLPHDGLCPAGSVCDVAGCRAAAPSEQRGRLIVSEFAPLGPASGERIEIYNAGPTAIDLRASTITLQGTRAIIVAPSDPEGSLGTPIPLEPGQYAYGAINQGMSIAGVQFLVGTTLSAFSLSDSADTLALVASDGRLEDFVDYTSSTADPNAAVALTMFPFFGAATTQVDPTQQTALGNDVAMNWCVTFYPATARTRVSNTLGASNGSCSAVVLNEVLVDATGADDMQCFVEIAGPGGAVVGGLRIVDVEGVGSSAGMLNTDGDVESGETDGEITLPTGWRIPVDGILIVADANAARATNVSGVSAGDVLSRDVDFENGGGDAILLINNQRTAVIDALAHVGATPFATLTAVFAPLPMAEGTPAATIPTGSSLARSAASADTQQNSVDFQTDASPSVGAMN